MSFLFNSLDKNLGEKDFQHLSQEFDSEVLELVGKKKDFIPMNTCVILQSLKNKYLPNTSFIVHWVVKELLMKSINMFPDFGINLE